MRRSVPSALVSIAAAALIAVAPTPPARAQVSGDSDADRGAEYANAQEYADCMVLAQRRPEDALGSAEAWEQRGGGDAAKHCAAVALFGMEKFAEAAERMESLGEGMSGREPRLAAQTFAQAGMFWQTADMYDRALAAQTAALKLAPDDTRILVERSSSHFFLGMCWEAIDDLNAASELAPERADILVLRASAYRCVEALDLAREDIDHALELKPGDAEALLERGTLRHLAGDADGARTDWLTVAQEAAGTPVADAAQMNLERLDLKAQ